MCSYRHTESRDAWEVRVVGTVWVGCVCVHLGRVGTRERYDVGTVWVGCVGCALRRCCGSVIVSVAIVSVAIVSTMAPRRCRGTLLTTYLGAVVVVPGELEDEGVVHHVEDALLVENVLLLLHLDDLP